MPETYPATGKFNTPEGFLYRNAVLARSGPFEYTREEAGLEGDGKITVHRSQESIQHPETLRRMRGAPLVIGHPTDDSGEYIDVTPDNWKDLVVGHVAGDPRVEGNLVYGDVMFGSKDGIEEFEKGTRELSIGNYKLDLMPLPDGNYISTGPLELNHIGLVPMGRAGSGVRVFDIRPPEDDKPVTPEELQAAIEQAATRAARDAAAQTGNQNQGAFDVAAFTTSFAGGLTTALAPMATGLQKLVDADAQAKQRERAKKLMDEAIKEATDEQAANFAIVLEARPLLSDEDWEAVKDAKPIEIVARALGDDAPTGGEYSMDYLRGLMAGKLRDRANGGGSGGGSGLPFGVTRYSDANPSSKRNAAIDEFAKMQDQQFADAAKRQD